MKLQKDFSGFGFCVCVKNINFYQFVNHDRNKWLEFVFFGFEID